MRRLSTRILGYVVVGLIFGACVTINIYFPAEKVESVAGEIVRDIRTPEGEKPEMKPPGDKQGYLPGTFRLAFSFFPSKAWAQENVTEVSNATIRALKSKMKSRYQQLKPFFRQGALSEGSNGYLDIADTSKLGLKEKRDLRALVDAENQDRKQLYNEVAKALKIDSAQVDRVAQIFATEWKKTAP